ncbi:DUF2017 domain-containing protein [Actinoalloteichus fjordicus]|uniref:DUF2017 family protein n=1 Tax=Actinoalloteichus fjordicus TaxID=1612552 RepID=A0AAC9LAE3_9PSEU|nr:DUF2017 domain-containing protein [Actinoalloteichus fjordicus]APU13314.1 putative DUF2017 family protein [Actinoalloteichus fjordicus]
MNGWWRRGDAIVAEFSQQEAAILRGLVGQLREMLTARAEEAPQDELSALTGIRTGPSTPPDERVLRRLLPDFHRPPEGEELTPGEADSAAALRSMHEPEVVDLKTGVAGVVLATCPPDGGRIRLDDEQASAWLAALNDVRLALGTVLEVSDDMPEELPEDDPRQPHLSVYHWLTVVQDTLVHGLTVD